MPGSCCRATARCSRNCPTAAKLRASRQRRIFPGARLLQGQTPSGVPLSALDCPELYDRAGGPYQNEAGSDWSDNALRFGLLSHVAALLGSADSPLDWQPDVVHCNDWQTGLAPAYLHYAAGARAATLQTIHNLAYQGIFEPELVAALGLPPDCFPPDGVEYYGKLSFLKSGLQFADAITTVSPTMRWRFRANPSVSACTDCSPRAGTASTAYSTASIPACGTRRPTP